jgi:hypothetical protein
LWDSLPNDLVSSHPFNGSKIDFSNHEKREFEKPTFVRKIVLNYFMHKVLLQWQFPIAAHSPRLSKSFSERPSLAWKKEENRQK